MQPADVGYQDVMLICRNGHVITDLLHTHPEHGLGHCDRCGADTLDQCPTCGQPFPGSIYVPGLMPVGNRHAPQYCMLCGSAFPWTPRSALLSPSLALRQLDSLLRRLPLVARQLRVRQTDKLPFRVEEERDLEDLVRSLLPVHFDEVRLEGRTPSYSLGTRTDFLLAAESIGLTVKRVTPDCREPELTAQWEEDVRYYQRTRACRTLFGLGYDPERLIHDSVRVEAALSRPREELKVRFVIAS